MRSHLKLRGAVFALMLSAGPLGGEASVPAGFTSWETELSISVWFGGFDYLPDGRLIVSDSEEVFILDGEERTVVARFETEGLFGSFVKIAPDGETVYVGESTLAFGTVSRFDLAGGAIQAIGPGTESVVASVKLNYDMEFDSQGRAFVSAATPEIWQPNRLLLLDTESGETDLIAVLEGNSGPLILDEEGNLFYCTSTSYPPEAVESVILFRRDQIDGAIGESHLTDADAQIYVSGIYGFADMVFDDGGDLFGVTTSGDVFELPMEGEKVASRSFATVSPNGATYVRFFAGKRQFEPYYQDGGTLTFLESDFWSLFRLVHVKPFPEFRMISVRREQGGTSVGFATEEGKEYQVYWLDDLSNGGGWEMLGPVITGVGKPISVLDPGEEQSGRESPSLLFIRKRFYRVGIAQ